MDRGTGRVRRTAQPASRDNTTTTLVSNTGQTNDRTNTFTRDYAQMLKTGTNADGYKLTSVVLKMLSTATTGPTYTVTIHDRQGISPPREPTTNLLGTLTNSATLPSTFGEVVFNDSGDGISLDANKFYWMVIDVSTGDDTTKVASTTSKDEDSGAATGWSIFDSHNLRSNDSSSWNQASTDRVLQIAVRGTVTDTTPPEFSSAVVTDSALTVTYDEDLDTRSVPAPGDFHVTVGNSRRNVADGGVAIAGPTVTLTLAPAVSRGDAVKVRYTRPDANPLRDAAGYPVATFADRDVTRNLLVGNLAQPPTDNVLLYAQYDAAQSFTTGATTRYTLTGVQLDVGVAAPANTVEPTYSASIHADSSGEPGESLGELAKPAALADGVNTSTAPGNGINLQSDTTYWVVVDVSPPPATGR